LKTCADVYCFGFNGQEKDDEVSGTGNTMTAEFWEYDSRLGRRFNIDPKPIPSISAYACFKNNPIFLSDLKGDSSVVNKWGRMVHYDKNDKDLRVFLLDKKSLNEIGSIGGKIDISKIYGNILKKNSGKAQTMDFFDFYENVKTGGEWDYKSNTKTIFGVIWNSELDKPEGKKTKFNFYNVEFEDASDIGNHHYGFVGKFLYLRVGAPDYVLHNGAGWAEQIKDYGVYWGTVFKVFNFMNYLPNYGDEKDDHDWINQGIEFAEKVKSKK